jgi:hypothetical protein
LTGSAEGENIQGNDTQSCHHANNRAANRLQICYTNEQAYYPAYKNTAQAYDKGVTKSFSGFRAVQCGQ